MEDVAGTEKSFLVQATTYRRGRNRACGNRDLWIFNIRKYKLVFVIKDCYRNRLFSWVVYNFFLLLLLGVQSVIHYYKKICMWNIIDIMIHKNKSSHPMVYTTNWLDFFWIFFFYCFYFFPLFIWLIKI